MKANCLALIATLLLAGCATPINAQSQLDACIAQVNGRYPAATPGVRVQRAEGFRDCKRATEGHNPFAEEFFAYWIYLAHEIEAGRLGEPQGKYMLSQKENELEAKRRAAIMQVLPYAIQQEQQQRPPAYQRYKPPPTYNTNCRTDPYGNTNCTTQRGSY